MGHSRGRCANIFTPLWLPRAQNNPSHTHAHTAPHAAPHPQPHTPQHTHSHTRTHLALALAHVHVDELRSLHTQKAAAALQGGRGERGTAHACMQRVCTRVGVRVGVRAGVHVGVHVGVRVGVCVCGAWAVCGQGTTCQATNSQHSRAHTSMCAGCVCVCVCVCITTTGAGPHERTCVATALASSVLPLPGGPYSSTPERRRSPDANRCLCTAQHSTAQHSTAQHSTAQHSTAQHSTAQHSTAQHSTAQHGSSSSAGSSSSSFAQCVGAVCQQRAATHRAEPLQTPPRDAPVFEWQLYGVQDGLLHALQAPHVAPRHIGHLMQARTQEHTCSSAGQCVERAWRGGARWQVRGVSASWCQVGAWRGTTQEALGQRVCMSTWGAPISVAVLAFTRRRASSKCDRCK
jgi:hypothetical protein